MHENYNLWNIEAFGDVKTKIYQEILWYMQITLGLDLFLISHK